MGGISTAKRDDGSGPRRIRRPGRGGPSDGLPGGGLLSLRVGRTARARGPRPTPRGDGDRRRGRTIPIPGEDPRPSRSRRLPRRRAGGSGRPWPSPRSEPEQRKALEPTLLARAGSRPHPGDPEESSVCPAGGDLRQATSASRRSAPGDAEGPGDGVRGLGSGYDPERLRDRPNWRRRTPIVARTPGR